MTSSNTKIPDKMTEAPTESESRQESRSAHHSLPEQLVAVPLNQLAATLGSRDPRQMKRSSKSLSPPLRRTGSSSRSPWELDQTAPTRSSQGTDGSPPFNGFTSAPCAAADQIDF